MSNGLSRARVSAGRFLLLAIVLAWTGLPSEAKPKLLDIADTPTDNPILTKFAAMIQASDLTTFLSSKGPFTMFVPTDSAFSKLPPGTLETLLRPENKERLQHILLFHLVSGKKMMAKDLLTVTSLPSCDGLPLDFKKNKIGTQYVLKAKIIHADMKCLNGVIHEVDTLLMPPESSLPPIAPPPPPTPPAASADTVVTPVPSASAATNAEPVIPVAPIATPETSPH